MNYLLYTLNYYFTTFVWLYRTYANKIENSENQGIGCDSQNQKSFNEYLSKKGVTDIIGW